MPKQRSTRRAPVKGGSVRRKRGDAAKELKAHDLALPERGAERQAELARGLVVAAWPEIVQGLIEKAVDGGYQQTKLLLDLCEFVRSDLSPIDGERPQQLCDVLLEGLGLLRVQGEERTPE